MKLKSIINKSNSALGFIRRNVITTSTQVKSTAFKQIVRPVLEYASGAWDSLTKTQEKNIEAVQRCAARLIFNICRTDHMVYWYPDAERTMAVDKHVFGATVYFGV